MSAGMTPTEVWFTDGQLRGLHRIAEQEGVSISEIVRRSVDRYMLSTQSLSDEARLRRALSVAGRFSDPSGARDVAERHDEYLAAIYADR